jgi:FixJ family two-component response regulator
MTSRELTVAIVDDDETVRRALRRMIASLYYDPVEYASGAAFLADPDAGRFLCVLLDLHMPDLNGIDVLLEMRRQGLDVPAIIVTGGDQPRMRERCMSAGASGYLVKPVERATVRAAIQSFPQRGLPAKPA